MLGVDEGADATPALSLGDHVVDEGRLAGGLRAEDLDDAAARQAADSKRETETAARSFIFMTDPLPNCRSIWPSATSSASCLSTSAS
jgi:hypothetical protein